MNYLSNWDGRELPVDNVERWKWILFLTDDEITVETVETVKRKLGGCDVFT